MTYTEFKKYCSILVLSNGQQFAKQSLGNEFKALSYFISFFISTSKQASELLSAIGQLRSDEEEMVKIRKEELDHSLLEKEGQEKMKEIYAMLPKEDSGDLIFKKGEFIYELAHNYGVIGLIKLLGQPEWKHGDSFYYRYYDCCIELDTQMNQTLNIRKNKTAVIGWEAFPKILLYETPQVYEMIDHWRFFFVGIRKWKNSRRPQPKKSIKTTPLARRDVCTIHKALPGEKITRPYGSERFS